MIKGFREFIMRGNVIDLAVAVVIGTAFAAVVAAVVKGLVNPVVNVILGGGVNAGTVCLKSVKGTCTQALDFSLVVNALITFLVTALVVYFVFVLPMNKWKERQAAKQEPTPDVKTEIDLLQEIADELRAQRGGGAGA
jgi:large conductance mechanosensitive channel